MSSPRHDGGASPRTPSALRNELAAAKRAVEVLKAEKQNADEKLEKLHAVLEKERNALRDVLSAARLKVDELEKVKKEQAEEIERLKALLKNQPQHADQSGEVSRLVQENTTLRDRIDSLERDVRTHTSTISERDTIIVDLRSQISTLQANAGAASDKDGVIDDLQRRLAELQRQLEESQRQLADARRDASSGASSSDEVSRLQKRIADLTESLQNTQKTMRDQIDASRTRESELREQLAKQRQELTEKIRELEAALRAATDASKAHVLERLQREVLKYRREACLRLLNSVLCRHHLVMAACMFHQWELIAKGQVLERRLLAECEYKLGRLRAELTPGLGGPFAHTPLLRMTHLATRTLGTPQRFDKWEQMSPRSGTGDGACTLSPRSSGRKFSPPGRSLDSNVLENLVSPQEVAAQEEEEEAPLPEPIPFPTEESTDLATPRDSDEKNNEL